MAGTFDLNRLAKLARLRRSGDESIDLSPSLGDVMSMPQQPEEAPARETFQMMGPDAHPIEMARPPGLDDASWEKTTGNASAALEAGKQYMRENEAASKFAYPRGGRAPGAGVNTARPTSAPEEPLVAFEDSSDAQSMGPSTVQSVDPRSLQSQMPPQHLDGGAGGIIKPMPRGQDPLTGKPKTPSAVSPTIQVGEVDPNVTSQMTARIVAQEGKPVAPVGLAMQPGSATQESQKAGGDSGLEDALGQSNKLKYMARMGELIDRLGTRFSRDHGVAPNTQFYKDLESDAQQPIQVYQAKKSEEDKQRQEKLQALTSALAQRKQGEKERHDMALEGSTAKTAEARAAEAKAAALRAEEGMGLRREAMSQSDRHHAESLAAADERTRFREGMADKRFGIQQQNQADQQNKAFYTATKDAQDVTAQADAVEHQLSALEKDPAAANFFKGNVLARGAGSIGMGRTENAIGFANSAINGDPRIKKMMAEFSMLQNKYQYMVTGAQATEQERASLRAIAQGTGTAADMRIGIGVLRRGSKMHIDNAAKFLGHQPVAAGDAELVPFDDGES